MVLDGCRSFLLLVTTLCDLVVTHTAVNFMYSIIRCRCGQFVRSHLYVRSHSCFTEHECCASMLDRDHTTAHVNISHVYFEV